MAHTVTLKCGYYCCLLVFNAFVSLQSCLDNVVSVLKVLVCQLRHYPSLVTSCQSSLVTMVCFVPVKIKLFLYPSSFPYSWWWHLLNIFQRAWDILEYKRVNYSPTMARSPWQRCWRRKQTIPVTCLSPPPVHGYYYFLINFHMKQIRDTTS